MKLTHTLETTITVEYDDLNLLICKTYDVAYGYYDIVSDQETKNDSICRFIVKKEPLDDYDQEQLDNWKSGTDYDFMTAIILNDLCNRGIIDSGKYYINICW